MVDRTRITVLGNSCGLVVARPAAGVGRHTYAWFLERAFADTLGLTVVDNASRYGRMISSAALDWERVLTGTPDLVVLNHGVLEALPAVVPVALLRWAHSASHTDTRRTLVALRLVKRGLRAVTAASAAVERRCNLPGHMSAWRFDRQVRRILWQTCEHLGVPVAVVDIPVATDYLQAESPGYARRRMRLQNLLEAAVEDFPGAFRVDCDSVVQELGQHSTYSDGLHFSAMAHERVAQLIVAGLESYRASVLTVKPGSTCVQ